MANAKEQDVYWCVWRGKSIEENLVKRVCLDDCAGASVVKLRLIC